MAQNRTVDTFKLNATQIVLLDRGKGISAPNLQAAIEEIKEKLDKIDDHLHRGEGENSIQIGLDSVAYAASSIALGHSAFTSGEAGRSVSLGAGAEAYGASSVAIGDGASAVGTGAVAIGPGAFADADNIIVLGNPGHTVIIPGNLDVLGGVLRGVRSYVSWMGPTDDVIAELPNPLIAEEEAPPTQAITSKELVLKNPGRYRIKGFIYAENGGYAALTIWKDDELIAGPVSTWDQREFSVDLNREIGMNTALRFQLNVLPPPDGSFPARGGVTQIRICGAPMDIGSGVIAW